MDRKRLNGRPALISLSNSNKIKKINYIDTSEVSLGLGRIKWTASAVPGHFLRFFKKNFLYVFPQYLIGRSTEAHLKIVEGVISRKHCTVKNVELNTWKLFVDVCFSI